ncbi:MAG: glycosyltransferase [Lachnospiraceae bacterium]|nr:glycosyltransferase [Lachnospiraceae bacterium]
MQYKISVIIAIYNIEPYLKRCLDSVINQTYRELEIILVNDGSADQSGMICDEYAAGDERIKVIHKANGGLSDARNAGMELMTGDFVGFVDGDDFIDSDMYESMIWALTENHGQIAVCRYRQVDSDGNILSNIVTSGETNNFSRTEALNIFISEDDKYKIMPAVWSKLFSREIVCGLSFAVGKTSEDIMFTTSALCRASRVVYLDKAFYNYVTDRDDSIMNKKIGDRRLNNEVFIWKEQIEFLKKKGYEELSDKAAYSFYRRMLFYFIDFKNWRQNEYGRRLSRIIRADKKLIKSVYRNKWVKIGDNARMKMFLLSPNLYFALVKLYDRFIIPKRLK